MSAPEATTSDKPVEDTPAVQSSSNSQQQDQQQQSSSSSNTNNAPDNSKRLSWTDKAKAGLANLGTNIGAKFGRKNVTSDEKESEQKTKEVKVGRLSMEGILKQARISFEKWVEMNHPFEYPMPNGIVFLSSVKGSLGWGAEMGTGCVFYRLPPKQANIINNNENDSKNDTNDTNEIKEEVLNENSEWSGPCAIGSGGISWGLQIGVSKIDHIIMLPMRHHVRTFTSQGQFKLGGSSELTVVNVGMKAQGSVNITDKEISDIHSYSLDTKGLALGVSIEGALISMRNDCNKAFYEKVVTPKEICEGSIHVPKEKINNPDLVKIYDILKKHFKIRPFRVHGPGPFGPPGPGPHGPHPLPHGHHHPHGPGPHPLPHGPGPYGHHPPPHGPLHMPPHEKPVSPPVSDAVITGAVVSDANEKIEDAPVSNENGNSNDTGTEDSQIEGQGQPQAANKDTK